MSFMTPAQAERHHMLQDLADTYDELVTDVELEVYALARRVTQEIGDPYIGTRTLFLLTKPYNMRNQEARRALYEAVQAAYRAMQEAQPMRAQESVQPLLKLISKTERAWVTYYNAKTRR